MEEVKDLRLDDRQGPAAMMEELMRKIPGYSGYLDREKRRDADKTHREYLAKRLTGKKRTIQDIGEVLMSSGGMSHLTAIDSLTNRLDRVTERTRHAAGGSGGFFSATEIDTEMLDRIYEHDLALLEIVEALDGLIESLQSAAETNDNVGPAIMKVKNAINDIDSHLDSRDKIMKGLD